MSVQLRLEAFKKFPYVPFVSLLDFLVKSQLIPNTQRGLDLDGKCGEGKANSTVFPRCGAS
jgi:hypothetical protein